MLHSPLDAYDGDGALVDEWRLVSKDPRIALVDSPAGALWGPRPQGRGHFTCGQGITLTRGESPPRRRKTVRLLEPVQTGARRPPLAGTGAAGDVRAVGQTLGVHGPIVRLDARKRLDAAISWERRCPGDVLTRLAIIGAIPHGSYFRFASRRSPSRTRS